MLLNIFFVENFIFPDFYALPGVQGKRILIHLARVFRPNPPAAVPKIWVRVLQFFRPLSGLVKYAKNCDHIRRGMVDEGVWSPADYQFPGFVDPARFA
jgi:hypothetical protein